MSNILEVSNLTKIYPPPKRGGQKFTAVDNVSFALKEGEVLGLLGPNGAGKSTTISMLMGTLTPTTGNVKVFGMDLARHTSEVMQSVTFASTYVRLPWRLTIMENLRIYGYLYGVTGREFRKRAEHFLKLFGVWEQRSKTMSGLSAGQITRVMLAKAFIPHPRIVLLDEPTASLDPDISHQVRTFILEQQKEFGTSILYTSHNMDEVAEVCDRVVFLNKGKVFAVDTPQNLVKTISIGHVRLYTATVQMLKQIQAFAKQKGYVTKIEGKEIEIQVQEDKIPNFLVQLAKKNLTYVQISIAEPSLEDYFLSVAHGTV